VRNLQDLQWCNRGFGAFRVMANVHYKKNYWLNKKKQIILPKSFVHTNAADDNYSGHFGYN
jgi:hypothetical protein